MRIVKITAHAGCTFNHPHEQYSNFRPGITLEAEINDLEENMFDASELLQRRAQALLEKEKQRILDECERPVKIRRSVRDLACALETHRQMTRELNEWEKVQEIPTDLRDLDVRLSGDELAAVTPEGVEEIKADLRKKLDKCDAHIGTLHRKLREWGLSQADIDDQVKDCPACLVTFDYDELDED